jgi:hypothetical protein
MAGEEMISAPHVEQALIVSKTHFLVATGGVVNGVVVILEGGLMAYNFLSKEPI